MDSFFNETSLMNVKTSTPISSIQNNSFCCNEICSSNSEFDSTPSKSTKNNIITSSFDQGQNDESPKINRNRSNSNNINNNYRNINFKIYNEPEDITENDFNNSDNSENKVNNYSSKYSVSSSSLSSQSLYQNINKNNKYYKYNISNDSLSSFPSSPINKNKICPLKNNKNYYQIPSDNKNSHISKLSSIYNKGKNKHIYSHINYKK